LSKQRTHATGLTHYDSANVTLYELHGIVDGHTCRYDAARGVDVKDNLFVCIFCFKEQHLRYDYARRHLVYVIVKHNDTVFKQATVDIVATFAFSGLLDYHWNKGHGLPFKLLSYILT
jgi:hypothetical protein